MAKRKKKRPRPGRSALWLVLLLLVGVFLLTRSLWPSLYTPSPRFNFLVIEKNGQPLKLLKGELLQLHPQDKIKIREISSNLFLNRGFRIFASDFDVNALFHEAMTVSALLPNRDPFNRYEFRILVKHDNLDAGHVDILVEPHVEDWLDKADRTIDEERRIALLEKALTYLPGDRRIRERLVRTYTSLGKRGSAAQLLEKMAAEDPDKKTLEQLIEVYGAMSDADGVIRTLGRLAEKEPENVEARIRLASALEESGRFQEAIQAYEGVMDRIKKEDRLPVYKILGYLLTKSDQPEKAVSAYLKALELDKNDPNLYYNLSSLYEKTGRQTEADAYLSRALALKSEDAEGRLSLAERLIKAGKMKEAEEYLVQVLEKDPKAIEALLLMIKVAEARKDKEALIEIYGKIHALEPGNETVIYNLGALEYETGDLANSRTYFEKLVEAHPKDLELHTFLFDIYKRKKNGKLAFREARTLIALNPKDLGPYPFLFEYLDAEADYKTMIEIMKKGLDDHPRSLQLREYLTFAYLKAGREDLAVKEMEKILEARPEDTGLLLQLAKLQEKRGDLEGALKTCERILGLSPDHKEARDMALKLLLQQARVREDREDFRGAFESYQKVLELSPGHERAREAILGVLIQWAEGLEGEGKFLEALQNYQRILALSPGHEEALEAYVRVLLRLARQQEGEGKNREALQSYLRILDLSPGHEEAEEAYLRLRLKVLPNDSQ